jgi:threonine/homoserine/homoserine lactone efflux protein
MTFIWLAAYALLIAKAGEVRLRPRLKRAIEGITGAVLIALGLRLAVERG